MSNFDVRIKVTNHNRNNSGKIPSGPTPIGKSEPSFKSIKAAQQQVTPLFPAIKSTHDNSSINSKSPLKVNKDFNFNHSITSSNSKGTAYQAKIAGGSDKDEELFKLKEQVMKLMTDKKYLSSEILRLQRELEGKDKIFKEISTQSPERYSSKMNLEFSKSIERSKENLLIGNLKKQYKELQTYCKHKEEESDRLKKNMRATKLSEIIDENKVFQNELTKLRELTYDLASKKVSFEKQLREELETSKGLKYKILVEEDKNRKLQQELSSKESSICELESKVSELMANLGPSRALAELAHECQKFKELSEQKDMEIENLKGDYLSLIADLERFEQKQMQAVLEKPYEQIETCNREITYAENPRSYDHADIENLKTEPIFNTTRAEELSSEKIEEISFLLEKMLKVRNIDINQIIDTSLFNEELFHSANFVVEVSRGFANLIQLNSQEDVDIMVSFVASCVSSFPKSFEHFKLKFCLMLESISLKNINEIHDSLRQKLIPYASDLTKEICDKNTILFYDLIEVFQNLQIELTEKENNYLIFIMKENVNSIFELKLNNLKQIITNQQLTSEDLRSNRIISSYRQLNQDHLYFIEQDFAQLLLKYNLDSVSIHSSRASSLSEKLSKYLSDRLLTFPEFISNEIFYIKIGDAANAITTPIFHINSLLKLMLKNSVVPELFKKEVYVLWVSFKVNLNRMSSDRHLIDALNDSNVQISPFIDMKLFEESLKLPKYSEEDKLFFMKLNDYLRNNDITFEELEFMLQSNLELVSQEQICTELIERNSNLAQFAHLKHIHVIKEADFQKFYKRKICKYTSHLPSILLIEIETKSIKNTSTAITEIRELEYYINLTFLREKLTSLKYVLRTTATSQPSRLSNKRVEIHHSASCEKDINIEIDQALMTRENDLAHYYGITETNKLKTDFNDDVRMEERNQNAYQFNNELLEQISSCQLQILRSAAINIKKIKPNSSYLEEFEDHEPRISKCNMFMIDESKANDFENYGFNDKSFKQTHFRDETDEHFNDFSLCNAFIDRIIEDNIKKLTQAGHAWVIEDPENYNDSLVYDCHKANYKNDEICGNFNTLEIRDTNEEFGRKSANKEEAEIEEEAKEIEFTTLREEAKANKKSDNKLSKIERNEYNKAESYCKGEANSCEENMILLTNQEEANEILNLKDTDRNNLYSNSSNNRIKGECAQQVSAMPGHNLGNISEKAHQAQSTYYRIRKDEPLINAESTSKEIPLICRKSILSNHTNNFDINNDHSKRSAKSLNTVEKAVIRSQSKDFTQTVLDFATTKYRVAESECSQPQAYKVTQKPSKLSVISTTSSHIKAKSKEFTSQVLEFNNAKRSNFN